MWRVPTAGGRRYFRGLFVIHVIVPESTPPPYCSHLNETRASRFIDVVFVLIVHQCQVTMKYIHLGIRVVWVRTAAQSVVLYIQFPSNVVSLSPGRKAVMKLTLG